VRSLSLHGSFTSTLLSLDSSSHHCAVLSIFLGLQLGHVGTQGHIRQLCCTQLLFQLTDVALCRHFKLGCLVVHRSQLGGLA
jgi:hypothetical protein